MTNFGLTSTEAFDFLAAGYQKGLDGSGDFLESVNEYSTQFANGGADAGQFFSVLDSGFSEGMLGTDKAGDAFKEFRVRIQDGSKTTAESLESIGIDPVAFAENMASGELTAIDAFDIVQKKLNETEDVSVQFNAGVGLMGTQFEDLGTKAALELSTVGTKIEDLSGTMGQVADDSDTFEKQMTAAFRTVTTEFGKNKEWDKAKDAISAVFTDIAASFGPAIKGVDFSGLEDSVKGIWDKVSAVFADNDFDLTSVDGMKNAIQLVVDSVETLVDITSGIVDIFAPIITGAIDLTKWFNSLDESSKTLIGQVLGVGTALAGVGTIISAGGSLLSGFGSLALLLSPPGLIAVGLASIAGLVYGMKDAFKDYSDISAADEIKSLSEAFDTLDSQDIEVLLDVDSSTADIALEKFDEIPTEVKAEITTLMNEGKLEEAKALLINSLENTETIIDVSWDDVQAKEGIDATFSYADSFDKNLEIVASMSADEGSITETQSKFETVGYRADGSPIIVEIPVSTEGFDDAKKEIDVIPTEKLLEIKLQGNIDTKIEAIKAQAEIVQTSIEWTAKVDIAQAEAAAQQISAAFEAASSTVESTSQAASDMFGSLASNMGDMGTSDKWFMQDVLEDQMEMEQQALDMQKELNQAQIEYMGTKTEAIQSGDSQIKIDGTGLSPALEMVMWEILELVQVKASSEQADFLLGL